MAPIPFLLSIRDLISDAGGKLKEAGGTVADGGKDATEQAKGAVDQAKDAGETIGQAKDLLDTFEKLKAQATGYYQFYLDHKPLIYFVLACIVLVLLLCALQCLVQYSIWIARCCCLTVSCGMWCVRHADSCCCCSPILRRCGACCIATEKCRPGQQEIKKSAEKRGGDDTGCDTTFITRCGAAAPKSLSFEDAQLQRLGPWINSHAPFKLVPGAWGRVMSEEDRDQNLIKRLQFVKKGLENLLGKKLKDHTNWAAAAEEFGGRKGAAICFVGERYDKLREKVDKIYQDKEDQEDQEGAEQPRKRSR